MDYEKKYKDALERAKKLEKTCDSAAVIGWCEYIFPELKESEDEESKKWILEYLYDGMRKSDEQFKGQFNAAIAWLEKQGEQKHFDYENANIQQKDFAPQKDIPRYSIGDVLCDKSCTTLNKESQSNFKITDIRNGMYICDKCSFPISQQDEYELVAKRIEQKPADLEQFINKLSKNSMMFVNGFVNCTDGDMKETGKPAWSEEDDYNVQCLVAKVVSDIQNGNVGRNQELIDWLKSLKQRIQHS